jgi:hypothetical protein
MPRAEVASKQAIFTLKQLHAELAGKFLENRNARIKIKAAMGSEQRMRPLPIAGVDKWWANRGASGRGALNKAARCLIRRTGLPSPSKNVTMT